MTAENLGTVNMHEAKTHLSKLVERVEAGEEIVISRAGRPAAKLVPVTRVEQADRALGAWSGRIELPSTEAWEGMDREIERLFEETSIFPRDDELWRGD